MNTEGKRESTEPEQRTEDGTGREDPPDYVALDMSTHGNAELIYTSGLGNYTFRMK